MDILARMSRSRRAAGILAMLALGAIVVAAALGLLQRRPVAVSPSPSAAVGASPSAAPTASPTPSPVASPSPISRASPQGGRFVNVAVGYSVDLVPPWRRSDCFSGTSGSGPDLRAFDTFVPVSAYDEESGHTGLAHDQVAVGAHPNPDGLTPRQWWDAGRTSQFAGSRLSDTTFAGRPALHIDDGDSERYLLTHERYMFEVSGVVRGGGSTPAQRAALIATFRFLSVDELAAARAAPTPAPEPARSAEQVADVLAQGFARKDAALLATVISTACVTEGVAQGGASTKSSARYLDELKQRFARGLMVEVRRGTLGAAEGIDNPNRVLQSTWREPGQPDLEVDLLIAPERADRWSWRGVITVGR